jgi:hypothetical protein
MNRNAILTKLSSPQVTRLIDTLRPMFSSLPHIPVKVREFWVKIVPWLAIIGAVFGAIGGVQDLLLAFGINNLIVDYGTPAYWLLIGVVNLIAAYIAFLSFPLLKTRDYTGWILLFWGCILSIAMSLVSAAFGVTSIVTVVITAALGLYLTFEIEEFYSAGAGPVDKTEKVSKTAPDSNKSAKK